MYELEDLKNFYANNRDPHVMLRDDEAVETAISEGSFFICIDVNAPDDNKIVAASAVYTVSVKNNQGTDLVLKEVGGSRVPKAVEHFGFHKIFHACRSLHKFILDRNGFDEYFGAIICPNEKSERNIQTMGFEIWKEVPEDLIAQRAVYAGKEQEIKFYNFSANNLTIHAERLVNQLGRRIVERRTPNGLEQAELVISTEVVKHYLKVVTDIIDHGPVKALELE